MRFEANQVIELASSIADGAPINWATLEGQASDEPSRRFLRALREVSALADAHRTLSFDDTEIERQPGRGRIAGRIGPRPIEASEGNALGAWGHLQLLARIGAGSSGDVYRAFDPTLQRVVAVKLLRSDASASDSSARLLAEARRLAKLRHPNVVAIYGADERSGRPGFWMELVQGKTLEEHLHAQGLLSANEAIVVGQDLCRALAAVHAAGVIHRDVKAQNVIREDGGRLVLMDFGAGQEASEGRAVRAAGTPLYVAPELLAGEPATTQSDIYSLGVLLFHLVTGSYPIVARSLDEIREAHAQGRVQRLRNERPDLPAPFIQVVERALAREPRGRYASAGELEGELGRALSPAVPGVLDPAVEPTGHQPRAAWAERLSSRQWRWVLGAAVVAGLILALVGFQQMRPRPGPAGILPTIRSVAVLPLQNQSGNPDYFVDGLTESLISTLGHIGALRVTSRTSSMQYKGTTKKTPAIAGELNVDGIIEGAAFQIDDRVRIDIHLVHGPTDSQLWTRTFEEPVTDLMKLHGDVARAIAEEVRLTLTPGERAALSTTRAVHPEAHNRYLVGRHYAGRFTAPDLQKAVEYYRSSLQADPDYARAHVGLAEAYSQLGGSFRVMDPKEARRLSISAAERAISLDPTLADAYAALAFTYYYLAWDWRRAEVAFQKAIELNPGYAGAHNMYANLLTATGRAEKAIEHARFAEARDPLTPMTARDVAWHYFFARRFDDAIAQLQNTLALHPDFAPALTLLGRAYGQQGRYPEAIDALRRAVALYTPVDPDVYAMLAQVYAAAGMRPEAEAILARLAAPAGGVPAASPYLIALVLTALDRQADAVAWLLRSAAEHDSLLVIVQVDPRLDLLRTQGKLKDVVARAGFALQ